MLTQRVMRWVVYCDNEMCCLFRDKEQAIDFLEEALYHLEDLEELTEYELRFELVQLPWDGKDESLG